MGLIDVCMCLRLIDFCTERWTFAVDFEGEGFRALRPATSKSIKILSLRSTMQ